MLYFEKLPQWISCHLNTSLYSGGWLLHKTIDKWASSKQVKSFECMGRLFMKDHFFFWSKCLLEQYIYILLYVEKTIYTLLIVSMLSMQFFIIICESCRYLFLHAQSDDICQDSVIRNLKLARKTQYQIISSKIWRSLCFSEIIF